MTQGLRDRIVAVIAEQAMLDPGQISLAATPAELGVDSLGLVESILAIEDAFGISIPFNANEPDQSEFDISSLATIVAAVEKLVADKE